LLAAAKASFLRPNRLRAAGKQCHAPESQILAQMAAAERDAGWLAACEEAGRHLLVTDELAEAVARLLQALAPGNVLELCAGRGELAAAVRRHGIEVAATDADPPTGSEVLRLDAAAALAHLRPRTVIGCFVPVDSRVDRAVLAAPPVDNYLVIAARINGQLGSSGLWSAAAWEARPLPQLTGCVITRHDTWLGEGRGVLRRGEAWLFQRKRPTE